MEVPRLIIRQQPAKIGLRIKPLGIKIRQKKADLQIQQPQAKMKINKEPVNIKVDNYPARYDLEILKPGDRGKEIARRGQREALKAIKEYVSQGDYLMENIDRGSIPSLIKNEIESDNRVEVGLRWKRGPEIKTVPAKLDIKFKEQKPRFRAKVNHPSLEMECGNVRADLEQYSKVEIEVATNTFKRSI